MAKSLPIYLDRCGPTMKLEPLKMTHWALQCIPNEIFKVKKKTNREKGIKQSKSNRGEQIEYTQFILTLALLLLNGLTGNS